MPLWQADSNMRNSNMNWCPGMEREVPTLSMALKIISKYSASEILMRTVNVLTFEVTLLKENPVLILSSMVVMSLEMV